MNKNINYIAPLAFNNLLYILFIIVATSLTVRASDSSSVNKKRLVPLIVGVNAGYAGSLAYLATVWYSKEDQTSFHFFNDLKEWKQVDKAGHATTAFHEGLLGSKALIWAGVSPKKSYLIGAIAGFLYQAPIEILDGYAPDYGASVYDLAANAVGSCLLAGQYLLWEEVRIQPKFSFHSTRFAGLRPEVLGDGLHEELLKDYNGQTYWLSANISSFIKNNKIPKWLNLSFGYGASEMVYARDYQNKRAGYTPYRQYYLSFDIDFSHVDIEKKWLKALLYPLNIIHIPFPAIEISRHGLKFHPLYF